MYVLHILACRYLEPDLRSLLAEELSSDPTSLKFAKLNDAIAGVVRALSDLSPGLVTSLTPPCRSTTSVWCASSRWTSRTRTASATCCCCATTRFSTEKTSSRKSRKYATTFEEDGTCVRRSGILLLFSG